MGKPVRNVSPGPDERDRAGHDGEVTDNVAVAVLGVGKGSRLVTEGDSSAVVRHAISDIAPFPGRPAWPTGRTERSDLYAAGSANSEIRWLVAWASVPGGENHLEQPWPLAAFRHIDSGWYPHGV